jgi:hypothetical protein
VVVPTYTSMWALPCMHTPRVTMLMFHDGLKRSNLSLCPAANARAARLRARGGVYGTNKDIIDNSKKPNDLLIS